MLYTISYRDKGKQRFERRLGMDNAFERFRVLSGQGLRVRVFETGNTRKRISFFRHN